MKAKIFMFSCVAIFMAMSGLAQIPQNCVSFETLPMGSNYGSGVNSIGDVILVEEEITVTVEYFEWVGGGGIFGNCEVMDGTSNFGTGQAMWTSNINLAFHFDDLGFVPNKVSFDFVDEGGEENISVNGSPIFAGEISMAVLPPGISMAIMNMGSFHRATLTGDITELLIGGQEFMIDNICAMLIEDPSDCVDFEMLPLGAEYGNGIHTIGEVIFTENDIPVRVEYFEWPGGGGTFGTATVIDGSASYGTGQAMWTDNINLAFDFSGLAEQPNWVTFDFEDYGGDENISVNGFPIWSGELSMAVMPPGFTFYITGMGSYMQATIFSHSDPITELLVGGQEFTIDNVCPMQVGFYTNCVDFEPLTVGTQYGAGINVPGEVIFNQNSIDVAVEEFIYETGGTNFGQAQVSVGGGLGSGNNMEISNINLLFDFTWIGMLIEMVTFDFADYGGHENIGVNGGPVFVGELTDAVLQPGFSISVSMSGYTGSCVIEGPVAQLLVGGQEFYIDNVCAYAMVSVDEPLSGTNEPPARLGQNYPNPHHGLTMIPFELREAAHVQLSVHDQLGRQVAVLADREFEAGSHLLQWDAGRAATGMYYYRLVSGPYMQVRKMALSR
jgi:hypothetical protein